MMSSVTVSLRLSANIVSRCVCVLDYIMHSDDMQVFRNHAHLVHNPRRDLVHTHRDHMMHRWCMYSRDRSRRTWLVEIVCVLDDYSMNLDEMQV